MSYTISDPLSTQWKNQSPLTLKQEPQWSNDFPGTPQLITKVIVHIPDQKPHDESEYTRPHRSDDFLFLGYVSRMGDGW